MKEHGGQRKFSYTLPGIIKFKIARVRQTTQTLRPNFFWFAGKTDIQREDHKQTNYMNTFSMFGVISKRSFRVPFLHAVVNPASSRTLMNIQRVIIIGLSGK